MKLQGIQKCSKFVGPPCSYLSNRDPAPTC